MTNGIKFLNYHFALSSTIGRKEESHEHFPSEETKRPRDSLSPCNACLNVYAKSNFAVTIISREEINISIKSTS
jgi:hypothetical protein